MGSWLEITQNSNILPQIGSDVKHEPRMPAEIPELTTARLILRPLQLTDADVIQQIFPHHDVVRFLSTRVPWPYPPDGALIFLRDMALPAMDAGTEWHWSIRLAALPERLIGVVSLMDRPNENRGFWLAPEWQRQGLMSEATDAVTDYWFNVLDRPILRAPKAVANLASRRISERSGMRVIATQDHDFIAGRFPEEIWEITREEWQNRPGKSG